MSGDAKSDYPTISLLFELDRNDNPWLYDDLIRFKKGTKRINRLRLLAHEGVVVHLVSVGTAGLPRPNIVMQATQQLPTAGAAATSGLPMAGDIFADPITDHG